MNLPILKDMLEHIFLTLLQNSFCLLWNSHWGVKVLAHSSEFRREKRKKSHRSVRTLRSLTCRNLDTHSMVCQTRYWPITLATWDRAVSWYSHQWDGCSGGFHWNIWPAFTKLSCNTAQELLNARVLYNITFTTNQTTLASEMRTFPVLRSDVCFRDNNSEANSHQQ